MADATSLFERASAHVAAVLSAVRPEQLALATPCSEWDVQALRLDPELVDACVAMFLPDMPERGRAAGLIGPAVDVPAERPQVPGDL